MLPAESRSKPVLSIGHTWLLVLPLHHPYALMSSWLGMGTVWVSFAIHVARSQTVTILYKTRFGEHAVVISGYQTTLSTQPLATVLYSLHVHTFQTHYWTEHKPYTVRRLPYKRSHTIIYHVSTGGGEVVQLYSFSNLSARYWWIANATSRLL